ncbi:MAG: response regulator [Myxococcota bacterium]
MEDQSPSWVFDFSEQRMLWANAAGLAFWRAETLEELRNRDFSTDSKSVRERLWQSVAHLGPEEWARDSWTLFPQDEPTTAVIDACIIDHEETDAAILFRWVCGMDFMRSDPEGLRMMLAARVTPTVVSFFHRDGSLLSENPAGLALRRRYPAWADDAKHTSTRYGDESRANQLIQAVDDDEPLTFDYGIPNATPPCVLSVTVRRVLDPVSGETVAVVTEEDITRQTELARSFRALNDELEHRVDARSRELRRLNARLAEEAARRTEAKQEAERERDFLSSLLEAIPVPVFYTDASGAYIGCNTRWCDHLGIAKKDLLKRSPAELDRFGIGQQVQEEHAQVIASQTPMRVERRLVRADGTAVDVVSFKAPYQDLDGRRGLIGTVVDITQTRLMEESLRRSQNLGAIGQLTGGIAHDFNNLLGVVLGNAQLMGFSESYDQELVEEIEDACRRGSELTRNLLAYARKQRLSAQSIDLAERCRSVERVLRRTLGANIRLRLQASPDTWRVFVDPGQFDDALLNLAINARDAMPNGGELTIGVCNARPEHIDAFGPAEHIRADDFVLVTVEDTGVGMSADVLAKATDPFFTTKGSGRGSGLGLSRIYGYAGQSGGDLAIRSVENRGTTIALFLPRDKSKSACAATAKEHVEAPKGHGETVLLVEDDEHVRLLLSRMLESLGYRVTSFPDGRAALTHLRSEGRADVLLSDMMLPGGVTGADLAHVAQQDFPDLPLVLMSGYLEEDLKAFEAPNVPLLDKPIERTRLARALRAVLSHR